jgi:hypothetical protein
MRIRRAAAFVFAVGVAVVTPAAASASTLATKYTTSYAGYYASMPILGGEWGDIHATGYLPYFSSLGKVTNGITSEIRVYSSVGEWDMQLGANPQTATSYRIKMEHGSISINCSGSSFPQGDTVTEEVGVNFNGNEYPTLDFSVSDSSGNSAVCGGYTTYSWPGPNYSKIAFVGSFNAKSFRAPSSPVQLSSFSGIDVQTAGRSDTTLASYPYGKYIATSTGASTGVKRAVPSGLDSTGSAFTVSIP